MAAQVQGGREQDPSQEGTGLVVPGGKMRCPMCETPRSIHRFQRLQQVEKYEMETNPVYVCPKADGGCGHVFSPGDHSLLLSVLRAPGHRNRVNRNDNGQLSTPAKEVTR